MSSKDKRLHELIQKHTPMTKKDVVASIKQHAEIKKTITTNAAELDANLKKFNEITDPLIDPETDTALVWIRRPTTDELESMIPIELMEYKNDPKAVPKDVMKRYEMFQFEMMANLITNPVHDAIYWKKNTNLVFQSLFQKHLSGVLEDLGISAENF